MVECGTDCWQDLIGIYVSSNWAERGFCKKCGSGLFYKLKETGLYIIPVGILDIESQLNFDNQVFIDEKPTYYCFSNKTKNLTGAELFAQFGAE